jgi:DNA-binding transcriptional regulator YhcF (GntR family)
MRFWLAHRSEVTIREQLVTQIVLAILCDDLSPGERLPSIRELARRFRLHSNTISAGYRQLEREGWVEFRHGSGVYVRRGNANAQLSPSLALDRLLANFFRSVRDLGVPLPAVRSRLRQWLELQPPDHFLLIEPDGELRKIVTTEIQNAVTLPVKSCDLQECNLSDALESAIPVALPSKEGTVRQTLPAGVELLTLKVRSVPSSLAGWLPAPSSALIGIASRWPGFLNLARTMLIAAGFSPDALVFQDARKPNWQRGLKQTAAVICDSVTAAVLPKGCRAIVFPLLAESSLLELRRCEESIGDSTAPRSM